MANLNHAFIFFHNTLTPTANLKRTLSIARDAIRRRIRKYFQEILRLPGPKFHSQGACRMDTLICSLNSAFDVDDGIYLQHLEPDDTGLWPAPDTIHWLIVNAVTDPAKPAPVIKNRCVRVPCDEHIQVDLPIYGYCNDRFLLADREAAKWRWSDPLVVHEWFAAQINLHGRQLHRIVRYLKAWVDFQSIRRGKMAGGFALTVLSALYFRANPNDDIAFTQTLWTIEKALRSDFRIINPVQSNEDLAARFSDTQKAIFQEALSHLVRDALEAVYISDRRKAFRLWERQLGARFQEV